VRSKVGDAVAELARQHTDEGKGGPAEQDEIVLTGTGYQWPELLGALFQASQSPDAAQRENAFRIFSTTPQIIEKQHEDVVVTAFKGGFADSETSVRIPMSAPRLETNRWHRCAFLPWKPLRPSSAP
jgi:hypothetical protein